MEKYSFHIENLTKLKLDQKQNSRIASKAIFTELGFGINISVLDSTVNCRFWHDMSCGAGTSTLTPRY